MAVMESIVPAMSNTSVDAPRYERTPFGKEMLKHFALQPGYRNLNHGSFGTFPTAIRDKATELRNQCEERPCPFIKYDSVKLLDESRAALAKFLNAPVSSIVIVPNATTGINTVLRNIVWNEDGKDEILQFNIIYDACDMTTDYVREASRNLVGIRSIKLTYPLEDDDVIKAFKQAIQESRSSGRRPRLALFDTVVSNPGLRFPYEAMTSTCRDEGILSLIDAAHGIGQVNLDLSALDPDFLVTNCHKWLFVPRACAAFYVPERNQEMMRSTVPTSHAFVPLSEKQKPAHRPEGKGEFVYNFEFVGTNDDIPYLCVPEAIKWREQVCGGEENIRTYCTNLAREGGEKVAQILGTRVLDNASHTLTNCHMINVLLPLGERPAATQGQSPTTAPPEAEAAAVELMRKLMIDEYKTFLPVFFFQGAWWTRLSGQVYLDMSDFEWAGQMLKELCERLGKEVKAAN